MKKFLTTMTFAIIAMLISACEPGANAPTSNKSANNPNANSTNTNSTGANNKPTAEAPTADSFLAKEKEANTAFMKGDSKHFEQIMSDKFAMMGPGHQWMDKAAAVKMISGVKCEVKSFNLTEPALTMINPDTAVFTYKNTSDGTCNEGPEGKMTPIMSPTRAATIWVREGEKWMAIFHGENLIIDPKNPPKQPPPAPVKKEETKTNRTKSANTDALVKIHSAGWEAFKSKDAKWFNDNMAANFTGVDPLGGVMANKADTIKRWTETMKCEGITKVGVTDGFSVSVSPTVEFFTLKGNADGSCDGQKNGDLHQSTLYVKEGEAWKLAFMFESM